jgi:hypothetical protein
MMKRRHFIINTALSAAAVSLPVINCTGPDPELDKKISIPEVLSQTYDENTIREIGLAFGKAYPDEYNINTLEGLLKKNTDGKIISASMQKAEINAQLDSQVKNDFAAGQTIVLNGWVLSLTEARQCALYTLISKK